LVDPYREFVKFLDVLDGVFQRRLAEIDGRGLVERRRQLGAALVRGFLLRYSRRRRGILRDRARRKGAVGCGRPESGREAHGGNKSGDCSDGAAHDQSPFAKVGGAGEMLGELGGVAELIKGGSYRLLTRDALRAQLLEPRLEMIAQLVGDPGAL